MLFIPRRITLQEKVIYMYFGYEALRSLFTVINGNLCIEFCEPIFRFWSVYRHLVRTSVSVEFFVVMNFSSSFSVEKTENGEFAVLQVLACVAVRVCRLVKIAFVSHVVRGVKALNKSILSEPVSKLAPCLLTHVTSGLGKGREEGLFKYLDQAKRLGQIIAFVRTSLKRFLC